MGLVLRAGQGFSKDEVGMLPIMGTMCDCLWEIVSGKQSAGGHG